MVKMDDVSEKMVSKWLAMVAGGERGVVDALLRFSEPVVHPRWPQYDSYGMHSYSWRM